MAKKRASKKKGPSVLGTGWKGGSFKSALRGYLKRKTKHVGQKAKKASKSIFGW